MKKIEKKHRVKPPPKEKYVRIKELECFAEVYEKIVQGVPIPHVAEFIQDKCEEYTDVTRQSLVTILSKYKKDLPPTELLAPSMSNAVVEAKAKFHDGMRELNRLDEIYEMQKSRVQRGIDVEKRLNYLNNRIGVEITTLMNIVKAMHDMEMDLGFNGGRDLGTVTVDDPTMEKVRTKYGDEVAECLEDPESRGRVLATISHLSIVANESAK